MKSRSTVLGLASLMSFFGVEAHAASIRGTITFNSDSGWGTSTGRFAYDPDSILSSSSLGTYFEVTSFEASLPTGHMFELDDYILGAGLTANTQPLGFGFSFDGASRSDAAIFGSPLITSRGANATSFSRFGIQGENDEDLYVNLSLDPAYVLTDDTDFFPPSIDIGTYNTTITTPIPEPFTILGSLVAFGIGAVVLRKKRDRFCMGRSHYHE